MANYKETSVTGTKWKRSKRVIIDNPRDAMPSIKFIEEDVIVAGDVSVSTETGVLTATMSNPAETFNLIHPETGAMIGSASYQELYVLMYSLYLHLADLRDTPLQLPEDPPNGPNAPIV